MSRLVSILTNRRFVRWIVVPHLVFLIVAWATEASQLIAVENPITIALSVAVCIAFLPAMVDAVWGSEPADPAALMVCGVFLGWEANALRSAWSMIWRALGAPEWLANTDFTSYVLFVLGYGAICHLVAPDAINGRAPRARWIKIGVSVGIGLLVAIGIAHHQDVATFIEWLHPPHDVAPLP